MKITKKQILNRNIPIDTIIKVAFNIVEGLIDLFANSAGSKKAQIEALQAAQLAQGELIEALGRENIQRIADIEALNARR
jgi:hypothetical protein